MAPSFDCLVSSLLCAEDDTSIFDANDYYFGGAESGEFRVTSWNPRFHRNLNQNRVFNGLDEVGLPLLSEESVALMLQKEHHHLPNDDYFKRLQTGDLDMEARKEAIDFIGKVHVHFDFGPMCEYLSVSYLDRFLSAYELPKGKDWMMQLLAVACVSLAAKMDESEVPLILDLQVGDPKFVFEAQTIQRMEVLVLSTLSWRMQAITPFSYIDYFLYKINDDKIPLGSSMLKAIQLISSTIKGIDLLEFKPSEIAAAVAISVAVETTTVDTEKATSIVTQHLQKERVIKCVEVVHDIKARNNASVTSVPQSPIGVLDAAACLSYKSDDTIVGTSSSYANSPSQTHSSSPNNKRRKLNKPYDMEL